MQDVGLDRLPLPHVASLDASALAALKSASFRDLLWDCSANATPQTLRSLPSISRFWKLLLMESGNLPNRKRENRIRVLACT